MPTQKTKAVPTKRSGTAFFFGIRKGMMAINKSAADAAVEFIESLQHVKGKWAGQKIKLEPWQRKLIRTVFGTLDSEGNRVIRQVYLEIPRKNGKSTLAAPILLYNLFCDDEYGAEIYSAASDQDQASIVFNIAAAMVRAEPELNSRCDIRDSMKRIFRRDKNSFYHAISRDAYTKHGYNSHAIVFDELHAQPDRMLLDVLKTSMGSRTQPLLWMITTAGYDRNSICYEIHQYAKKVLAGIIEDPSFHAVIYAAKEEDDWRSPKIWKKANPNLGVSIGMSFLEQECRRAEATPAYQNTFRRLHLNQWTQQENRWLDLIKWDACGVPAHSLEKRLCYGGLDLASTTDIAALVLVFPPENGTDVYDVLPFFWIPEEAMLERSLRDRVPYDVWVRDGLIEATPGNVIDYAFILERIQQIMLAYDLRDLAFDRWGSTKIVADLVDMGFEAESEKKAERHLIQFGQGFASMSPPTKELMNLVLSHKINHDGNPVLRWMADNMVVRQDPAGNLKPDKGKSTEKIDGMVALIMALSRALMHKDRPVWDGTIKVMDYED